MKRAILTAMCLLLAPTLALATGFTANLSGNAGTGVAVISISGNLISYDILVSGLDPAPSSATVADGQDTVDLGAVFVGGSAFGSVESDMASSIAADPAAWTVTVTNGTDSLTGTLMSGSTGEATTLVFPVAANVTGQAGTNFLTDARLINHGAATTVTLDYYQESAAGQTAATASAEMMLAAGEQVVLNDIVGTTFGKAGTKGAVVASSEGMVSGSMRIYNDQTDAGLGTFGQFVKGAVIDAAPTSGTMPFLSNEDSATGTGYRANIGWFNPNDTAVDLTLTAYDTDGTMLGSKTFSVAAMAQEQFAVSSAKLWPGLDPYGDFYLMYSVGGNDGIFVYASVVDNVNGDAIFIAAE